MENKEVDIKTFIKSVEGRDEHGISKADVTFVSTKVNINTNQANGSPVKCTGASVKMRNVGRHIMLDLSFSTPESVEMKMVFNYLEKYAKDLDALNDETVLVPEVAIFISSKTIKDYYILFANPLFWSWHTTDTKKGYDTIRILIEEENYGYFLEE